MTRSAAAAKSVPSSLSPVLNRKEKNFLTQQSQQMKHGPHHLFPVLKRDLGDEEVQQAVLTLLREAAGSWRSEYKISSPGCEKSSSANMDEMDRLKKLILSGRSPLDDCPPEMKTHPVFAFWRLVNKEVEKMNRARADAYNKKFRKFRRSRKISQREPICTEETSLVECSPVTPEPKFPPRYEERKENAEFAPTIEPINPKYEDEGVKELRNLTTVEELYQMADKIIGVSREADIPTDKAGDEAD